jgi:hypothetical protein
MRRRLPTALAPVLLLLIGTLQSSPAEADGSPFKEMHCDQLPSRVTLPGFEVKCSMSKASSGPAVYREYESTKGKWNNPLVLRYVEAVFPLDADILRVEFIHHRGELFSIGTLNLATALPPHVVGDLDPKQAIEGFAASSDSVFGGQSELDWDHPTEIEGYHVVRFKWLQPVNLIGGGPKACFTFVRYGASVGVSGHHTRSFGQYCESATMVPVPPVSDQTISSILGALPKAD